MDEMSYKFEFTETEMSFIADDNLFDGVLTMPVSGGPFPAIILLHGSDRGGKDDPYYLTHAENLVRSGYAVFRYDGPGWGGGSSSGAGFETLESRTAEAIAIVKYLHTRPDIQAEKVGLWGISQGGWVCQMAAARSEDVAFIIPVSGPGVTPAEQEVFRVEAQSKAAGFKADEVAKAVLVRRLMVDLVLAEPKYSALNLSESERLGGGPWRKVMALVYGSELVDPDVEFVHILEMFQTIRTENWAEFLHLDQVLMMFENLSPQAWEMVKLQMRAVQKMDPADFLIKIKCPVLAIFGENDTSIPVTKSISRYRQYLYEAGNEDITIKVFPKASHTIRVGEGFAPGYFECIQAWLSRAGLVYNQGDD